jgi:hypothetical protein
VQPAGVVAVRVGGVLGESGGLSDALGQVFREVADVAAGFFGAAQDALDVHLFPESHDVSGLGQVLAGLSQVGSGVSVSGSVKALALVSQTGIRSSV